MVAAPETLEAVDAPADPVRPPDARVAATPEPPGTPTSTGLPAPSPSGIEVPWQTAASRLAIALGAIPRIWAAIWDHGILWPDEVHQTLEQAHRLAFHYGLIPWEFRSAARSWVFPGLLGLYWMLVSHLGVHHSFGLVVSAKLLMVAISLMTIEVGRRLALVLAGPNASLLATLLLCACPLLLYFSARATTETASGLAILAAAYLAVVAEKPRPATAGFLASLSIFFRYQNGLIAAGLLLILAWRGDWGRTKRYAMAATAVGLAGGMLDWITWSFPFQSFWVYLKFNLIDGKAAENFGSAPFGFYFEYLERSIGACLGLLGLGLVLATRRAPGLVVLLLVYFLTHSLIAHKELRFLLPIVPLAMALAAVGLADLSTAAMPGWKMPVCLGLAMAAAMGMKATYPQLRDLGRSGDESVWHIGEDYFQTMWAAEAKPDLCGIALVGTEPWWTGGHTYLHRHVPIYFDLDHLSETNYVVGGHDQHLPDGWKKLEEIGKYALYRRDDSCTRDPNYKGWLN